MAIIENGKTCYQIVTPGRSFPVENKAARYLQEALIAVTGVRIPVRWGDRRITRIPTVWLGTSDTPEPSLWNCDSYEIKVKDEDLYLRGNFRRCVHYAVSAFLESIGVRYFSPEHIHYPKLDRIDLPEEDVHSEAAFSYRHVFYPDTEQPEWALRQKLNVHNGSDIRWGINAQAHSFGHSFQGLIPPAEYFEDHPEYFCLVDGYRRREHSQICGTNSDAALVVCENIGKRIKANPDKKIFAVGQNDWLNWCECPECSAVDEHEGTHMGQVLTLVNRVAERFPDKIIATLAYSWSVEPPKQMRVADNALIVLCHNEGCFSHGLDKCKVNEPFLNRLKGWKKQADNILIWDYYVNYRHYLLPTANFRRLKNDLKLYSDIGIRNMFCQNSVCTGGQFEHLRQYIESKLLWNPDEDIDNLLSEWCEGVLGEEAGGKVLEYINMLEDKQEKENIHRPSFSMSRVYELFTPEVLSEGKKLWDEAGKCTMTDKEKQNLSALRSAEMASRLVHTEGEYILEGSTLKVTPEVNHNLVDRFTESCKSANVSYLREDTGSPEDFKRDFGRTYETLVMEDTRQRAIILPEMGGRIYSFLLKEKDIELLAVPNIFQSINCAPYSDGYDFSITAQRLGPGAVEEYFPLFRDLVCAVLEAPTERGCRIQTEFRLQENGFSAKHTVANRSREEIVIEPIINPAWNRSLFDDTSVLTAKEESVLNPDSRNSRDLFFEGDLCPDGNWSLYSKESGIKVTAEFPSGGVKHTRLIVNGWLVQMQHCFKKLALAPGETAEYESSWIITES